MNRVDYTQLVLSFDKATKNIKEYKGKIKELELVIEAQGVRLLEMPKDFEVALLKVKTAYESLQKKFKRSKFWAWVKGLPVGAAIIVVVFLF